MSTTSICRAVAVVLLVFEATETFGEVIPPDLPPGSQYQLIFVTAGTRDATSSVMADYNDFVAAQAALNPALPSTSWHAVGNTATTNVSVNAPLNNLALYNTQGNLVSPAGVNIYSFPATLVSAPRFDQFGLPSIPSLAVPDGFISGDPYSEVTLVWTGGNDGQAGPLLGSSQPLYGSPELAPYLSGASFLGIPASFRPSWFPTLASTTQLPLYALSSPITVVPEPSSETLCIAGLLFGLVIFYGRRFSAHKPRVVVICACAVLFIPTNRLLAAVILPSLPPGSQYQLVLVTANGRDAMSTDIADYNQFVIQQVAANPLLPATTWSAIASTSTVDAIDNALTYPSIPLYNTHGELVASGTNDFWFPVHTALINYDQFGLLTSKDVWTGTNPDGSAASPLGGSSFNLNGTYGRSWSAAAGDWTFAAIGGLINANRFYAMSAPITVPVPEPSAFELLGLGLFLVVGACLFRARTSVTLITFVLLTSPQGTAWAATPLYRVTDLGFLDTNSDGFQYSLARGINNSGQVVGSSYVDASTYHAFLFDHGTMLDLGTLGGSSSAAFDINDNGQIVGEADADDGRRAFLYDNGTMNELVDPLLTELQSAAGINSAGQIICNTFSNGKLHAYLYDSGVVTSLESGASGVNGTAALGIGDDGAVVGFAYQIGETIGHDSFLDDGDLHLLGQLGGARSQANDINSSGRIVGWGADQTGEEHAFLYSNGVVTELGVLPGATGSMATAINDAGLIVGSSGTILSGSQRAFLYDSEGIHDLNGLLDSTGAGWTLVEATGINDHGWIVGTGRNPDGNTAAFLLVPVPEPSTWALGIAGALALAGSRLGLLRTVRNRAVSLLNTLTARARKSNCGRLR